MMKTSIFHFATERFYYNLKYENEAHFECVNFEPNFRVNWFYNTNYYCYLHFLNLFSLKTPFLISEIHTA